MTYELALQLKNAGFPQDFTPDRKSNFIGDVKMPTLSDLIEAVKGNNPNSFYLEFNDEWSVYEAPNKDGMWYCRYYDLTPVGFYDTRASTPEEAVALLWLTLNKK